VADLGFHVGGAQKSYFLENEKKQDQWRSQGGGRAGQACPEIIQPALWPA